MNCLWEIILQAMEYKLTESNIYFKKARIFSPYMEVSSPCLNQVELHDTAGIIEVEVNPYYRFYHIFKEMFEPEMIDFPMLRNSLTNLMFHLLAENDVVSGMSKEEYYKNLLYQDVKVLFGEKTRDGMELFDKKEIQLILSGMLRQYKTGSSLDIFTDMMEELIPDNVVYHNKENYYEILIYIGQKCDDFISGKIEFLIRTFVEIPYHVEIYYEYHFGIIGIDETMIIDEIALC